MELLESRTLLAAELAGVESSGSFVSSFNPSAPAAELALASAVGGELKIDVGLLPEIVTELRISGFDTVALVGADAFTELELSHIGKFSGAQIDVTSELTVNRVGTVQLQTIAGAAWFTGSETRFEIEDARSATIVSALDRLTINSQSDLNLLSTNLSQKIVIEFSAARPKLMFESEDVVFSDLTPSSEPDPDDQPSYSVVIISLSEEDMSEALKAALKRGDVDAVRNAFAELKTIQLGETVQSLAFSAGERVKLNLAGFSSLASAEVIEARAARVVSPLPAKLPMIDGALADEFAFESADAESLVRFAGARIDAGHAFGGFVHVFDARTPTNDTGEAPAETYQRRAEGRLSLATIRDALSGVLNNVTRFSTVSAYIISDVETRLEPGALPGLLVDAKSARMRKDAIDWIEV